MKFHFIGIGGAGMSVVAELLATDAEIAGSDKRDSQTLERLRSQGIKVYVGQREENVDPEAVVVVSSAIRDSNPELAVARRRGQRILHRSQALALAATGKDFLAVAGAHGKTTTSAMIAVALNSLGLDPSWGIGGSVVGVGSGSHAGQGSVFVAEADESDASFLNYTPRVELVTNVEPDHLDHYGSTEAFEEAFAQFARCMVPGGLLIACSDSPGALRMAEQALSEGMRVATYGFFDLGLAGSSDVTPNSSARGKELYTGLEKHIRVHSYELIPGGCRGILDDGNGPVTLELSVVGEHNLLNAAGAWAAGVELGCDREEMARALRDFKGTGRRFERKGEVRSVSVVDDYAHHPTELAATLRAARATVGQGKVRVLFQPHLYSRTRNFAQEFAKALLLADDVIVTAVYGAREDPIPGVEGDLIVSAMKSNTGEFVANKKEAAKRIAARAEAGDMIMTVGAGDVTELAPVILSELEIS